MPTRTQNLSDNSNTHKSLLSDLLQMNQHKQTLNNNHIYK